MTLNSRELEFQSPSLAASLSDHNTPARDQPPGSTLIITGLAQHHLPPAAYRHSIMGVFKTLSKVAAYGTIAGAGGWALYTRKSNFVPLSTSDYIYNTTFYARNNPEGNPATADLCVRRVPLSEIKPEYLEKEGKLVEKFCAGVWGGLGEYMCLNGCHSLLTSPVRLCIPAPIPRKEVPRCRHGVAGVGHQGSPGLGILGWHTDHRPLRGAHQNARVDHCSLRRLASQDGGQTQRRAV
jgi:hypothetical protein